MTRHSPESLATKHPDAWHILISPQGTDAAFCTGPPHYDNHRDDDRAYCPYAAAVDPDAMFAGWTPKTPEEILQASPSLHSLWPVPS